MVDKFKVNYCLKNAKDNDNNKSIHENNMDYHHQHINSKCNNVGVIKLMKRLRSLVMKKLKGMTVINRLIAVLLLCACLLQLSTLMTRQRLFIFRTASGPQVVVPPSPRIYESNGFFMVSSNGGLNQMRAGICDMVAIARYLNATLVVPELDKTSFWNDHSEFGDIFDMEHFITSLRDQVTILKELPKQHATPFSMPPVSWSNLTFYDKVVLPRLQTRGVVHFTKTDSRLANNGIPLETQLLRCRVNYQALKFTPQIEETGKKIVKLLRKNGPFVVLHLRYEMDMLAFSGCTQGCNDQEIKELTKLRYAYPWWKEKEIDSNSKRKAGRCPLTPEEAALALRALDIDSGMQIYIAAGDIYGGEKRLALLRLAFPRLVKKETLLRDWELEPFRNHSNQMAALDYFVALESDVFVPTHKGNMASVVEGHRRYLGYKTTIVLNKRLVVYLVDRYQNGALSWTEFAEAVKTGHAGQFRTPAPRLEIRGKPKEEQNFYSNPYECLPPFTQRSLD